MNVLDLIITKILSEATMSRPKKIKAVSLVGASHFQTNDFFLVARHDNIYSLEFFSDNRSIAIDIHDLRRTARFIDRFSFAPSAYGRVKESDAFQAIYGAAVRELPSMQGPKSLLSIACRECELYFPVRNITVDHQRSQAGGHNAAIVKVFRACGLTVEGPKGEKGQWLYNQMMQDLPVKKKESFIPSAKNRYTLNGMGMTMYSLALHSGQADGLGQICMHNMLNLKPLCGYCNSVRGNAAKDYSEEAPTSSSAKPAAAAVSRL